MHIIMLVPILLIEINYATWNAVIIIYLYLRN